MRIKLPSTNLWHQECRHAISNNNNSSLKTIGKTQNIQYTLDRYSTFSRNNFLDYNVNQNNNLHLNNSTSLLFLHGSPGGIDYSRWYASFFVNALDSMRSEGEFRAPTDIGIVCVSRPGYIGTNPVCHSFEEEADVIHAFLEQHQIPRVIPVCVSGGALCALNLAMKYPKSVSGIVMMGPVSMRIPWKLGTLLLYSLYGTGPGSYLFSLYAKKHWSSRDFYENTSLIGRLLKNDILDDPSIKTLFDDFPVCLANGHQRRQGLYWDYKRIAALDEHPNWKKVTAPLVCLHNQRDYVVPLKHSEYLINAVGSESKQLIALDQMAHIVSVDGVKEALRFLSKHSFE